MHTQYDEDGVPWRYVECCGCGLRTRGKWARETCPVFAFYEDVRAQWNTRAAGSGEE